jgi:MscS family membrane protein
MNFRPRIAALALFVATLAGPAAAQIPGLSPSPTPVPEAVGDPYRRETPRGSFLGFISAGQKENWALATEYLQFKGNPPKEAREKLAKEFTAVLDQHFMGDLEKLSRSPLGSLDDGLPQEFETAGQIQAADESVDVLLVRVTPSEGVPIWLVSTATLRDVPRLAAETASPNLGDKLPGIMRGRVASLHVWQIAGLVIGFPLLVVFFWFFLGFVSPPVLKVLSWKFSAGAVGEATGRLRAPLSFLLAVGAHRILVPYLALPLFQRYRYQRTFQVFLVVGVAFLLTRLIGVFTGSIGQRLAAAGAQAPPTLTLARRLLTGAVTLFAVLAILALYGVDLTATLAGLGIGGIALAFAAQKSLENVFGGFLVLSDKILRVGDTVRIGNTTGDVEDVTLYATRLRTFERTLVYIPNGTLMTAQIENRSRRDRFWFSHTIGLRYETTPAQLRTVLEKLRARLSGDARVDPASMRVRFIRLGASSLDVEVFAYVMAPDWASYLTVQEEFLLAFIEIVAESGTSVAFPSRTVYLGKDVLPGA